MNVDAEIRRMREQRQRAIAELERQRDKFINEMARRIAARREDIKRRAA